MKIMDYASVASTASSQPQQGKRELDRDAFMRLLTTQMQSQDPLSPTDNTEFVAQLSQFTSLERMEQVARSVELMALGLSANTSAQMVNFVGRQVEARTDKVAVTSKGVSAMTFEVKGEPTTLSVEVRDAQGKLVRTLEPQAPWTGRQALGWDGLDDAGLKVPEGTYTVKVVAQDMQNKNMPVETRAQMSVRGVHYASGTPRLELEGDVQIGVADILWAGDGEATAPSTRELER